MNRLETTTRLRSRRRISLVAGALRAGARLTAAGAALATLGLAAQDTAPAEASLTYCGTCPPGMYCIMMVPDECSPEPCTWQASLPRAESTATYTDPPFIGACPPPRPAPPEDPYPPVMPL